MAQSAKLLSLLLALLLLCSCSGEIAESSSAASGEIPGESEISSSVGASESKAESSVPSGESSSAAESSASSEASSSAAQPPASSAASSSAPKPPQNSVNAPDGYYVSLDYYLDPGFYANEENAGLLSGAVVDSEHIVPVYSLKPRYDLMREPSEVAAFLEDYDGGKTLSDMCEQSDSYYCVLSDGSEAVLRLKNGVLKVSAVSVGGGSGFLFPAAVSGYGGNAASAKNLAITRLLRGILVSDGSAESFIVLEAYEPFSAEFKQNTLYPVSDIVEFIRENKDYGF